jgi:hypothetical protein
MIMVRFDRQPLILSLFHLGQGVMDPQSQLGLDPFACHVENIPVGPTGGWFEVFPGLTMDIENLPLTIRDDRGRGKRLEEHFLGGRTDVDFLCL